MKVRCPACKTVNEDPPSAFTCPTCGRGLAWRPPPRVLYPEQMWLFDPDGAPQALQLDLEIQQGRRRARPQRQPTAEATESESTPFQSDSVLQRAVALVTAYSSEENEELVTAIVVDQDQPDLIGLGLASAWLCAALIKHVDDEYEGVGTMWLRDVAAKLASLDLP